MPVERKSQTPTPSASSNAAVSRSTRVARASRPSRSAAPPQIATKTASGMAARCESSSNGRASGIGAPLEPTYGRIRYSQPAAATSTEKPASVAIVLRNALSMSEVLRGDRQRLPRVVPPQRPVVAARDEEERERDTQPAQLCCEP